MAITKLEKNKEYPYKDIALFALEDDTYMMQDNDVNVIGLGFISLEHNTKDIVHSFILTSTTSDDYYYTCVYTDN